MPMLGPTIGPQQWESFHLDTSLFLVYSEVNMWDFTILHPMRLLRAGRKSNSNFREEMMGELSCSRGTPYVAKEHLYIGPSVGMTL